MHCISSRSRIVLVDIYGRIGFHPPHETAIGRVRVHLYVRAIRPQPPTTSGKRKSTRNKACAVRRAGDPCGADDDHWSVDNGWRSRHWVLIVETKRHSYCAPTLCSVVTCDFVLHVLGKQSHNTPHVASLECSAKCHHRQTHQNSVIA